MKRPDLFFHLRPSKSKNSNSCTIYMRITYNGLRAEQSLNQKLESTRWDFNKQRVKGNSENARTANNYIDLMRNKVYLIHREMIEQNEFISAKNIKDTLSGKSRKHKGVLEVFSFHNQKVKERVGIDMAEGTYKKYLYIYGIVERFIQHEYGKEEVYLSEVNHQFVTGLDHYFRTVRKCANNSTVKSMRLFKRITNLAIRNEWMAKDPFKNFTMKLNEVKRGFLTEAELNSIVDLKILNERLDLVRDIFIFSCYTGLAYIDVKNLRKDNIVFNMDGDKCISMDRTKTKSETYVPLFERPLKIMKKYEDHPKAQYEGRVLPILSNQKMNAYLKEIADLARVEKNITFHLARHTFATTVLLNNNVPYESVKVMLGHKDIKTTQHYAKVMNSKVNNDVRALRNLFSNNDKSRSMDNELKIAK